MYVLFHSTLKFELIISYCSRITLLLISNPSKAIRIEMAHRHTNTLGRSSKWRIEIKRIKSTTEFSAKVFQGNSKDILIEIFEKYLGSFMCFDGKYC